MSFNKKINDKLDKFQKKTEKIRNKINYKKSYKYILLVFLIGAGYIFFLSSGAFFESNNRLTSTELNKKIVLKNSEVFIKEEQFNEEKNLLEIKLGVNKTNINFANDFEFEAIARENTNKKLPVEFMVVDENNIVVFVTTPKKWSAIAVDIKEKKAKEVGETRVYIDERVCSKNDELEKRTKEEYMIENIEQDLKEIDEVIAKYEEEIEEKKVTIENTNEEINLLESKKEYLTDSEKLEVNQKIDSYKSNITSLENSIKEIEKNISEEKEKQSMANKKMNDIIKSLPDNLYDKYR